MAGNDSVLYTGASSVSLGKSKRRSDKTIERSIKRDKLLPVAEVLEDEIKKTLDSLARPDQDKVNEYSYDGKPNTLEIYMASRVAAAEEIKALWTRLQNLLRDNKEVR